MPERFPVILDVDTGIDDSLAILYAAASPEVELVAVTCVAGNVPGRQVAENTQALLELVGRDDVPVALGAESPLVKALTTTEETHGPLGVGHAVLSRARAKPRSGGASLLARLVRDRPGELHLITLGPLTNLALALREEPALPGLLRGWTFMGGAFRVPGNTTPTSEWNVHVDPDAAAEVLRAWSVARTARPTIPLPLGMGLDATETARLVPSHVATLARAAGASALETTAIEDSMTAIGSVSADPVMHFVVDALRFYFEFHAAYDGFYGAFVHDPFAVAATLDPSLVRTTPVFVDVETGNGLAHGMTVADWRGLLGRPPNVAVAVEAVPDVFLERLVERVASLSGGVTNAGGRGDRGNGTSGRRRRASGGG